MSDRELRPGQSDLIRRALGCKPELWWRLLVLRVERQITLPLRAASASLFLIRVYHYAWDELSADQRAVLRTSLEAMPQELRNYKSLPTLAALESVLARAAHDEWRDRLG